MDKKRRWRTPKTRSGQLKIQYGKLRYDSPDIIYCRGEGVPRCDGSLLHHVFGSKRYRYDGELDESLYDELEKRGYDLTTLSFSIEKKQKGLFDG